MALVGNRFSQPSGHGFPPWIFAEERAGLCNLLAVPWFGRIFLSLAILDHPSNVSSWSTNPRAASMEPNGAVASIDFVAVVCTADLLQRAQLPCLQYSLSASE
eukprot:1848880-Amphidinium_carterae.1